MSETRALSSSESSPDPWRGLRRHTPARIALGRAGGTLPTSAVLDFRLSHARARDAVHHPFDAARLEATLSGQSDLRIVTLATAVANRMEYLARPDLGRRLSEKSRTRLTGEFGNLPPPDLVVIISDGLASAAAERHASPVIQALIPELHAAGWSIAPVFIVPLARVKLQDEIGAALQARFSLMLLGERPGLSAPDSLGAYFTANPGPDCTDADRNCISNIRPEGIPPDTAARKLAHLLLESRRSGRSGVHLKDEHEETPERRPVPRLSRGAPL